MDNRFSKCSKYDSNAEANDAGACSIRAKLDKYGIVVEETRSGLKDSDSKVSNGLVSSFLSNAYSGSSNGKKSDKGEEDGEDQEVGHSVEKNEYLFPTNCTNDQSTKDFKGGCIFDNSDIFQDIDLLGAVRRQIEDGG